MIEWILLGAGALFLLGRKKQTVAGIGKVATHNPDVVFYYNGIKINENLIKGSWLDFGNHISFYVNDNYSKEKILSDFFVIENNSNSQSDYYEQSRIIFSNNTNSEYYIQARMIIKEIAEKKEKRLLQKEKNHTDRTTAAYQKWLDSLEIKIGQDMNTKYAYIYRSGNLLGILSNNQHHNIIFSDYKNMGRLKSWMNEIGFDNLFAAYF